MYTALVEWLEDTAMDASLVAGILDNLVVQGMPQLCSAVSYFPELVDYVAVHDHMGIPSHFSLCALVFLLLCGFMDVHLLMVNTLHSKHTEYHYLTVAILEFKKPPTIKGWLATPDHTRVVGDKANNAGGPYQTFFPTINIIQTRISSARAMHQ